ncbi:hypothetical protein [Cardinium endosymbiont of Oedothorax gibbosus]|uniref:hypothetical protein n=1 Tax=Cardinium endosymbiont of Oedothorax gibbosus TaxID=931101 RepID=UPI002024E72B|nr:hypothetical protein [Cardinium endosymbiont of Oedothorax gibbosus]
MVYASSKNYPHKVEVYFTASIKSDIIPKDWSDKDGSVQYFRFFSFKELKRMDAVAPNFLKEGKWLKTNVESVYERSAVSCPFPK